MGWEPPRLLRALAPLNQRTKEVEHERWVTTGGIEKGNRSSGGFRVKKGGGGGEECLFPHKAQMIARQSSICIEGPKCPGDCARQQVGGGAGWGAGRHREA